MNIEVARSQMLGQQIRAWQVLDPRVLEILGKTPRERFVPAPYRDLAFADTPIPIGHDQAMMIPQIEGRLLQALQIESIDEVLEIGTGSGYLTACLAQLGARVHSLDIFADFIESARGKFAEQRIANIHAEVTDASGLITDERYDVIAITASLPALTGQFTDLLRPGGRLFAVIGHEPVMEAQLVTRNADGTLVTENLFETCLAPLINVTSEVPFEL